MLGTLTTMAPEVMAREAYGLKADIWSIGVIFFQMMFGTIPYKSNTTRELLREITEAQLLKNDEYLGVRPSKQAKKFL
jgi:serine/threonine protein kinase